jgi:hypothetical protein
MPKEILVAQFRKTLRDFLKLCKLQSLRSHGWQILTTSARKKTPAFTELPRSPPREHACFLFKWPQHNKHGWFSCSDFT